MAKWHLIEIAKKYNLPITVIITSLAICDRVSSQIDEIDEFDDSMEENWEIHSIPRNLPADYTNEIVLEKFKTNIKKYNIFNRLSLPLTVIIVLLSCKIHNIPPLIPRTLPGCKFSRKKMSPRKISPVHDRIDIVSTTFSHETSVNTLDSSEKIKVSNSVLPKDSKESGNITIKDPCVKEESENIREETVNPVHQEEDSQKSILDIETHNRIENKILNILDFHTTVPDTASILIEIGDKLMFTNEKNVKLLEKLLAVHMDGRIKQFGYFSRFKNTNGNGDQPLCSQGIPYQIKDSTMSQEKNLRSPSSFDTKRTSHSQDSAMPQSIRSASSQDTQIDPEENRVKIQQIGRKTEWKRSPIDILIESQRTSSDKLSKTPVTLPTSINGSNISTYTKPLINNTNHIRKENAMVEDNTEYVLAYEPRPSDIDTKTEKLDQDSLDLFHSNVIDCCLALLDEEDLIRYEITMGENRSVRVQEIKKIFYEYTKIL